MPAVAVTGSPPTTVVIGFAEALAAPEVVWSLVDAGCSVVAFGRRGQRAALAHSRHVTLHEIPAPEIDVDGARSALIQLLNMLRDPSPGSPRQHVLLPMDDTALWLCSQAADATGWTFAGPRHAPALDLALNKRRQLDTARLAGLTVPDTFHATTVADLERVPMAFPVILRPADALRVNGQRLHRGHNWICSDERELAGARAAWNGDAPLLVQPYLDGTGEGVFGLMTDAGVVGWSAHRRLRMMNPHGSGSSACVSRRVDESLKGSIAAFLESAGWRGLFMIELLRSADGQVFFVEFNGRVWGSMALARRQGLEYPAWAVALARGDPPVVPQSPDFHDGVVCRNLGRELMYLAFVLRGRRSQAVRAWPSFWSALRDVFRWHRNSSFYNWRRGEWRVFVSDCVYTVLRHVSKFSGT